MGVCPVTGLLQPASEAGHLESVPVDPKGLKRNALTFASNVVIGVASAAPAYSIASALGTIAAIAAYSVPAVLLAAFVPMLCVAAACYHLNRADPDCGTTFAWVTRAMGPYAGWMGGWGVLVTNILVMPSLAAIAGQYLFRLVGIADPASGLVTAAGVAWIAIMTGICYRGVEASARTQRLLLISQFAILVLFAVVALVKVYGGGGLAPASRVSLQWFNPFAIGSMDTFTQALLVAVFIYWGWDTGLSVNEETENPETGPGLAAITSNVLLVGIYVLMAVATLAFAGPEVLAKTSSDVLAPLGLQVLGRGLDKLVIIAVLLSASACTLTSILPNARTALSMAKQGALPERFGSVHPVFANPDFGTLVMGATSIAWFVGMTMLSQNLLDDSILALGLSISFYYALTAFSCVILFRGQLMHSVSNFLTMGVMPVAGGLMMAALFVQSCLSLSKSGATQFFGVGGPLVLGVGALLLGLLPMLAMRIRRPEFFRQ